MAAGSQVRNDLFDAKQGHERGACFTKLITWYLVKCLFFLSPLPWPRKLRVILLKLFGASVGYGVYIKPRVNVHYPWKFAVGDHTWIGEEVCIINFEPVSIGKHCCVSQRATICSGNHDFRDPAMSYRNAPITICDGAWIGCGAFVGPGVTVAIDTVVTAGCVIPFDTSPNTIYKGNPAIAVGFRWK
jgi:putative colanic acid biosynthesis acetyltransferase WcaF